MFLGYVMVAKNNLDTTQTTYSRTISIRGAILVKIGKFISENASFLGYFTKVSFDTDSALVFSK